MDKESIIKWGDQAFSDRKKVEITHVNGEIETVWVTSLKEIELDDTMVKVEVVE